MYRRLTMTLAVFGALSATSREAAAQCCSLDLSGYASMFRGINDTPLSLVASGGGASASLTLTYSGYDPSFSGNPYPLIGRPSAPVDYNNDGTIDDADGTTYEFGGNGLWRDRVGIFLNSQTGTLRFDFNGFTTSSVRVFAQFSDICWLGGDPDSCSDGFFGVRPRLRAYRSDATFEEYLFTEADFHPGVESGAFYTLRSGTDEFVRFEATGSSIAIGSMEVLPEPGSIALVATGLVGVLGAAWRRRRTG